MAHPSQFALQICGNISSKIALVNQEEMPCPFGSGHPEFFAEHLSEGFDGGGFGVVAGCGGGPHCLFLHSQPGM